MASAGEINCLANPDFAVICSFLDRYGETLGLPKTGYANLQEWIEDSRRVHPQLVDIHVRLLRRTHKKFLNMQLDRWEKGLVKFCHRYSAVDAWEIERFGYKIAKVSTKLTLLKNLLETQFDYNIKFKEKISEIKADEMRCQPLGRDKNGLAYWYFLDEDLNLRIFREDQDDVADETWELVCRSRDDLAKLISNLENGVDTKLEKAEQSDVSDASFKSEPVSDANEDSRDSFYSTKHKVAIGQSPLTIKQEPTDSGTSESGIPASESDSNLSEPKIVLKIKQGKCEVDSPSKQLKDKFEREKGQKLRKIKCKLKEEIDGNTCFEEDSEENAVAEEQESIKSESEEVNIDKGTGANFIHTDSSNKRETESQGTNEAGAKIDKSEGENKYTGVDSNKEVVRGNDSADIIVKLLESDNKGKNAIACEAEIVYEIKKVSDNCNETKDFNSSVSECENLLESRKDLDEVKTESYQSRNDNDSLKEAKTDLKNEDDSEKVVSNLPQGKSESEPSTSDHLDKTLIQSENGKGSEVDCIDSDGMNKSNLNEVTKTKEDLMSDQTFDKDIPQRELPCDNKETEMPTCVTDGKSKHESDLSEKNKESTEALLKANMAETKVDESKDKKSQSIEKESNNEDKDKSYISNERTIKVQSDKSGNCDSIQEVKNIENTQTSSKKLLEGEGFNEPSFKASEKDLMESEDQSKNIVKTQTEEKKGDNINMFDNMDNYNLSSEKENQESESNLANKFQKYLHKTEISKDDSTASVNKTKDTKQKEDKISADHRYKESEANSLSQHILPHKNSQETGEIDKKKEDKVENNKDNAGNDAKITDNLSSAEQYGNVTSNFMEKQKVLTSLQEEKTGAKSKSECEMQDDTTSESDAGQKEPEHRIDSSHQNKENKSTTDKTENRSFERDDISKYEPVNISDGDKTPETKGEIKTDITLGKVDTEADIKDEKNESATKDNSERNSFDKEVKNVQENKQIEGSNIMKSLNSDNVESTDHVNKDQEKILILDVPNTSSEKIDDDKRDEHIDKASSNETETNALQQVSSDKHNAENVTETAEGSQSLTNDDISKPKVNRKRKKDEIYRTPNESSTDEEIADNFSPEIKARKIKTAVRKSTDLKDNNEMVAADLLTCEDGLKEEMESVDIKVEDNKNVVETGRIEDNDLGLKKGEKKEHQKQDKIVEDDYTEEVEKIAKNQLEEEPEDDESNSKEKNEEKRSHLDDYRKSKDFSNRDEERKNKKPKKVEKYDTSKSQDICVSEESIDESKLAGEDNDEELKFSEKEKSGADLVNEESVHQNGEEKDNEDENMTVEEDNSESQTKKTKAQKRQANESTEEIPAEPASKRSKLRGRVLSKGRGSQRAKQGSQSENSSSSDNEDVPLSEIAESQRREAKKGGVKKRRRKWVGSTRKKSQARKKSTPVKQKNEEDEKMESKSQKKEEKDSDKNRTANGEGNDEEIDEDATDIEDYSQADLQSKLNKSTGNKTNKALEDMPTLSDEDPGVRRSQRVRNLRARKRRSPSPEFFPSDIEGFFHDDDEFQLDEVLDDYDDDDDDDDFSLRKKRKAKLVEVELPKGRNALRYEAKTKKKVQKKVVEEEPEDETPCCKCLKSEQPEWILLCDKCDAGYHTACLRPPLMIIPDGDWFCPPCEQNDLITKLTEHLKNLDQSILKNDRLQRRKERLAFVSISLDNVLKEDEETAARGPRAQIDKSRGQKARKRKGKEEEMEETEEESVSDSGSSTSESDSSGSRSSRDQRSSKVQKKRRPVKHRLYSENEEESPPRFVQRKCRSRNPVSYKFEEFEEMIADAIHDDISIPKEPKPKKVKPLGISRGKDMSNILGISDEESKPKSRKKRKPRLTELDEDFDDDDTDDYQMSEGSQTSSASASKSVDSEASEESVERSLRRTRSRTSVRKSARDKRRKNRRNRAKVRGDFVVDSDYDSAEERYSRRRPRRKTARYFNYNTETEDEESFATSELDDSDFERKRQKRLLKKDKKHKKSKKKSGKRHRIKRISSSDNSDGGDEEARPSVKKKGRKNRSETEESGSETEEETPQKDQKKSYKTEEGKGKSEHSESGSDTEVSDGKGKSVFKKKNRIQSDTDEEHVNEKGANKEEEQTHEHEQVGEDPDSDSSHDDEDGWEEIGAESTDEVPSPKKTPAHLDKNKLKRLTVTLEKLADKPDLAGAASAGKDTTPQVTPTKKKGKQAKTEKGSEDSKGKAGETTGPKKRGRKPKQTLGDTSQDTQGEETPVKKKRGKKAAEPLEAPVNTCTEQGPDADNETEQPVDKDTEDKPESDKVDGEKGSSSDRKEDSPLQSRNKQNAPVGVVKPEVRQGVIVENKQVIDNRLNENRSTESVVNPLQGMREMAMRNQGDQSQEYGGFGPYPNAGGGPYQNRGMEGGFIGPQGFQSYHQGHGQYGQGMSGPVQNHPYGGMSQGHPQGHPQGHSQNMSHQQGSMNQSYSSPHSQSQYPPNSQAQGHLSPNRFQHGNQFMPPNMQQGPGGYYHGNYSPQGVPEGPQNYSFGPQGPQQGPHHGPQNPNFAQGNFPPGHYHPGYHTQHGPYQPQMQGPPYGQQASHPQMGPQGQMQPQQRLPYQNMPYNYPHAPQARHPPGFSPQSSHMQGMNSNQPLRPEPQVSVPQYHQLQSPNMGGHRMHSPAPMNSPAQSMGSPHTSIGSPSSSMNSPGVVKPSAQVPSQTANTASSDVDSKTKTATPVEEQQHRTNMGGMQEKSQKTMEPVQRKGFMMANILKPKSEKSEDKSNTGEPD